MSVISRTKKWGEGEKRTEQEQRINPDREFLRWGEMVDAVENKVGAGKVIHVMDREADSFELLAAMMRSGARFVVRMAYDRALAPSWPADPRTLTTALAQAQVVLERAQREWPSFVFARPRSYSNVQMISETHTYRLLSR
jgi:hypothetical protein